MPAVYDPEQLDEKERRLNVENPDEKDNQPANDSSDPRDQGAQSPEDLYKAEASPNSAQHENTVGGGYKPGEHEPSLRSRLFRGRRRKAIFGGSIVALIIAGAIALFISLIPLKILHLVNNLQSRFYATSENAMDKEVDRLFSGYIKSKIKAGCKGVIDNTCQPFDAGDSLVTRLYRGWHNGKLENKFWNNGNDGFRIRYLNNNNRFEIEFRSANNSQTALLSANFGSDQTTISDTLDNWQPATRSQIRQSYYGALQKESRYKRVMYYIKVSRLLSSKYGIRFCVVGCPQFVDKYDDWKDDKRRAMKMFLTQRILVPRAGIIASLYECILSPSCTPEKFTELTPSDYEADVTGVKRGSDIDGEPLSEFDRDTRTNILIASLLKAYNGDVNALRKDYNDYKTRGILGVLEGLAKAQGESGKRRGKAILTDKLLKTAAFTQSSNAIPIVGQINMAFNLVNSTTTLSRAMPKIVYVMNATAAAQFFSMYRTHADEINEGKVDAEIVGSFVNGLGPGVQIDSTEKNQIGGTAEAEQTSLYSSLIGSGTNQTKFASFFSSIFSKNVSAAEPSYLCENGQPPAAGQLICDEEKIRQDGNTIAQGLKEITDSESWGLLQKAAEAWQDIKSKIFSALGFVCKIPIVGLLCDGLEKLAKTALAPIKPFIDAGLQSAIEFVLRSIFGFNINQVTTQQSGGRSFNLIAAGADVSGNDYAHHGLGGRVLSSEEVAAIRNEQTEQRRTAYFSKPFLSRLYDTESEYSPAVQIAMALPSDYGSAKNKVITALASPFKLMFSSFASLFSVGKVGAVPQVIDDPFGITQYGYPVNDPALKSDSDEFWRNNCVGTNSLTHIWNQYGADRSSIESSYMPVNDAPKAGSSLGELSPEGTNRCLLIQAAVGSAGAIFTDDVLSAEELADNQPASSGGGSGQVDCSAESGVDQSPGEPPAEYRDFIIAAAESLTCPDYPKPDGAVPSDPGKQYMAYDGCSDNCAIQGTKDGRRYIQVRYRNPPLQGNKKEVFVDP